jgi:signal transduction histidine kinase/CheY-like chemotaxis protein/HPt (histidine-containing phosphotransfer) domain-containing protein
VLFTFILMAGAALAQTVQQQRNLILTDKYDSHFLSPYLYFYDIRPDMTADDILALEGRPVNKDKNPNKIVYLPASSTDIWIGFDIINRSAQARWGLDFGNSFDGRFGLFDKVEVYTLVGGDEKSIRNLHESKGSMYHIDLSQMQKSRVLVHLDTTAGLPSMIPLRLVELNADNISRKGAGAILLIAFLMGMAFFFAAISFTQQEYGYLSFSLYYLILTAILFLQNVFTTATIPLFGAGIMPLLYFLLAFSALLTARLFWNIQSRSRIAQIPFYALIYISLISLMAGFFLFTDQPALQTFYIFVPVLIILLFVPVVSIILLQQGYEDATAYMFGWFIFLFGVAIAILPFLKVMQPVSTAINAYWFALIPQAVFFIAAAKFRIANERHNTVTSKTLEINENESVSSLRQSRENTEQERLLKVIEQERKILSELRKSEARRTEEMRKAKDEADRANSAKSAFLAVVTHEIRTPMTGIMGMVRLLLESNLSKDQKTYAQTIQDSSDAMLALLNDILDFEKIEQGKMTFENISFDLHRLVQGVATLMNGHAIQKNIELRTVIGEDLPRYVKGDPTRLRQVLLNLTGNAVKFTEKGHVAIKADRINISEEGNIRYAEIYFGITDSGIGISAEAQRNLFNPFSQADSSISRKFGGTGLGLAISRGLVQAMGSEINIQSQEGKGSTFFFTIKMPISTEGKETSRSDSGKAVSGNVKPLKILVVDDNEINQAVVKGLLEKQPHELDPAKSGEEALDKLRKNTYDLALMDIELPGIKGDEVARRFLSSDNSNAKKIVIIALTGNLMPDEIDRFYKSGMADVLEKPIDPERLMRALQNVQTGHYKPALPVTKQPEAPAPQIRTETVKSEGSGAPTTPPPEREESLAAHEIRLENPAEKKEGSAPAPAPSPAKKDEPVAEGVLDNNILDNLKTHIDEKSMREMIEDVLVKTDELVADAQKAAEEKDLKALALKCHDLKGMTGNFGMKEISDLASVTEKEAKAEQADKAATLAAQMPETKKRAETALLQWLKNAY